MTTVLDEIASFLRKLFTPAHKLPPPGVVPLHGMGVLPGAAAGDPYLVLASLLRGHGYRRTDMPAVARVQIASGLAPDGLCGPATLDRLVAYLTQHNATITLAGVKAYPFKNQSPFFDGVNAPIESEWLAGSPPPQVHAAIPDLMPASYQDDAITTGNAAAMGGA